MVNYVRKLLKTNVAAFKKHARVCTKVALALDKDHLLIDAGLLCVANSEVDDYVCSLIKDSRGKECPPILVAHLAQVWSLKQSFTRHFQKRLFSRSNFMGGGGGDWSNFTVECKIWVKN